METPPFFPHLNAALNATALVLLVTGYLLIKRGRERGHKIAMLSCFAVSVMFLASYLRYHGNYPRRFLPGDAAPLVYNIYQFILWTHIAGQAGHFRSGCMYRLRVFWYISFCTSSTMVAS